jgi:hypothetical protein
MSKSKPYLDIDVEKKKKKNFKEKKKIHSDFYPLPENTKPEYSIAQ